MPKEVDYSHFGMIGHMKDCFWGLFGVFWIKPLPVFQMTATVKANYVNHASLLPTPSVTLRGKSTPTPEE